MWRGSRSRIRSRLGTTHRIRKGVRMNGDVVVLVDEKGHDLLSYEGRARTMSKLRAHRAGVRHKAISVFVFNDRRQVLLQRRVLAKYHSGGLWTNTCCSHPMPGEAPREAAARRLAQEMGLSCPLHEACRFSYCADVGNGLVENEFDHVFVGRCNADPSADPGEAMDWKWMDIGALRESMASHPQDFSYWLKFCFDHVVKASAPLWSPKRPAGSRRRNRRDGGVSTGTSPWRSRSRIASTASREASRARSRAERDPVGHTASR